MTAADPNVGADGLTEAGRLAQYEKAVAAAKANGTAPPPHPAAVAAADQAAAAERDMTAGQSRTAKATAARRANAAARRAAQLAEAAAGRTEAAAARVDPGPAAQAAPAEAQAAPAAPAAEGPCEPCLQHWQAVGERLDRLETQVQAIGKLVVVGVVGGAVAYFLSQRARPQLAISAAPVAEVAEQPQLAEVPLISEAELAEVGA